MTTSTQSPKYQLPRVAITYCTQCRWMLRAAYFGQELLSTFGTKIGEIALIPATGGIFTVYLTYAGETIEGTEQQEPQEVLLWDRKAEGGFPETKILKQRLRNHIDPERNLGHSDKPSVKGQQAVNESEKQPVKEEQPVSDQQQEQDRGHSSTQKEDVSSVTSKHPRLRDIPGYAHAAKSEAETNAKMVEVKAKMDNMMKGKDAGCEDCN